MLPLHFAGIAVLLLCGRFVPASAQAAPRGNFTTQELYDMTVAFYEQFIYPEDISQAATINSSLLSEDVVGRVDVTASWAGRELNTEYLFGLFANLAQGPTAVSLTALPTAYEIIHFVGVGDTVATAVILQSNYTALGLVLPIELDTWFTFNAAGEVSQYDATFRWFDWAQDLVAAKLAQNSQLGLGIQPGLAATLVSQICAVAEQYCTGSNQQYDSAQDCASFLSNIQVGTSYQLGFNTLGCRSLHTHMLPLRPSVHCSHIGKSGGDSCISRDYVTTVTGNPFVGPPFIPEGLTA